jgi:hypothetical protein
VKTPLNIFEISFYRPQTYLGYLSTDIFSAFQRDFYNQITQNVFNQDSIEIHAHIRGAINDPSRVTPPETLLKVLDKLLNILKAQNQPINLHLYTDIPRVDKVWQLNHANDGGTVLHWKTLGILDNDLRMSISGVDFENILSSRAAISTLSIQRNLDPIQMWQLTERAHIFVGCDSMVSFFMGLFNEKALSFFPSETSFPKKNNWFTLDRLGNLLELSRIRYNLKERGLL